MNHQALKVIISGGGTGGHIYPAVAVAQILKKRYPDIDILFVGASDRMEMEKIPKAGFKIEGLWISGLQRKLTLKNLLFPLKVINAVFKAIGIINRFKPDVAIGFGGYASGALMYAATLRKVPTVIHEQNSYAGITNKILKNKVNIICVAYDKMNRFFPEKKIVKTGNPIRQDLLQTESQRDIAIQHFKLSSDKKTILIIGGSLGAKTINESIQNGYEQLVKAGYQLIWQTGKNFPQAKEINHPHVHAFDFIYEMNLAYAACDIVISRAGALSIAELAQVKKPVILVPSPNVAEDHQTKNAMALVNREAAIIVKDSEARSSLIDAAINLLNDEAKQIQLKSNISTFNIPQAAEKIADEIAKLLSEK
jgi:UDP-N-acetylglucosamine--N-acetylmuramyl-(pentapeptide) pyrophosphoryl-undecaprenol N-acetylglucosamine transferase